MSFAKCAIYLTNIYVVRKEESLPTWERGLKRPPAHTAPMSPNVAPHAGAWIETSTYSHLSMAVRSLPMRERGLKLA